VDLAYAQAVALVAFLMAEDRAAFAQALAALRAGRPFADALEGAYGAPTAELERRWLQALTRDYRLVPLLTGGTTLWAAAALALVAGYVRRRRRARARLSRWEEEEGQGPLGGPPVAPPPQA
jgi:hypothetical protein